MFIIVPMSFSTAPSLAFPPPGFWLGYYRRFFADPNWTGPVVNSLLIGLGTMVLATLLGTPASFALVRYRFRARAAFRLLVLMPLIVPHIVMALGYYSYFGSLGLVQSMTGVILAHTCLSIPVVVLTVTSALANFDRGVENAAANLHARKQRSGSRQRSPWWASAISPTAFRGSSQAASSNASPLRERWCLSLISCSSTNRSALWTSRCVSRCNSN
jgi:ABC-type spermidine/putrescine transport system permease subunit II